MDPVPPPRRRFFPSSSSQQPLSSSGGPHQRTPGQKQPQNTLFVPKPDIIQRTPVQQAQHQEDHHSHHDPPTHDTHTDKDDQDAIFALVRKNNKLANALSEKERELAFVRAQHDETMSERSALEKHLENTKVKIKNLNTSLVSLENSFRSLRLDHEASKARLNESRSTLFDIEEAKNTVLKAFEATRPLLDDNGYFHSKWKSIVSELHEECLNAHQTNDHLRSKLENIVGELSYAKERVSELEAAQTKDGAALQLISQHVAVAGERVSEMAALIAKRDQEQVDVLQNALVIEEKLHMSEAQITELKKLIEAKEAELTRTNGLAQENTRLATLIQVTKETNKAEFFRLHEQIEGVSSQLKDAQERKGEIEAVNAVLKQTEHRLSSGLDEVRAKNEHLSESLQAANNTLLKERFESQRTIQEKRDRVSQLEDENAKIQEDYLRKGDSLTALDKRFSVLQERYEDQTILLRSEKERSCNLQDQLVEAKLAHSAELDSLRVSHKIELAKLSEAVEASDAALSRQEMESSRCVDALDRAHSARIETLAHAHEQEIASLEEQLKCIKENNSQQVKLYEAQLSTANDLSIALRSQLEQTQLSITEQKQVYEQSCDQLRSQLHEQMEALKHSSSKEVAAIHAELLREIQIHKDGSIRAEERAAAVAEKATAKVQRLEDNISHLERELELARGEVSQMAAEAVKIPAKGLQSVDRLKEQVHDLEAQLMAIKDRSSTMRRRFNEGLLDEEEQALINFLLQMTESMHEQKMVDKDNELRRRDNTIIALQNRVRSLEAVLATHLKDKGKDNGDGTKSLVGMKAWASSSPTSMHNVDHPGPHTATTGNDQNQGAENPPSTASNVAHLSGQPMKEIGRIPLSCSSASHCQQNTTFTKLGQEDSEDEALASNAACLNLGKRERGSSPLTDLDQDRAPRRVKAPGAPKITNAAKGPTASGGKKAANTTTYKVRTRKR